MADLKRVLLSGWRQLVTRGGSAGATFRGSPGSGVVRVLKFIIAAALAILALTAGIFVVAIAGAVIAAVFLVRWAQRQLSGGTQSPAARRPAPARTDVIEVSATEVSDEKTERLKG